MTPAFRGSVQSNPKKNGLIKQRQSRRGLTLHYDLSKRAANRVGWNAGVGVSKKLTETEF
jgi:hypothetical protein